MFREEQRVHTGHGLKGGSLGPYLETFRLQHVESGSLETLAAGKRTWSVFSPREAGVSPECG